MSMTGMIGWLSAGSVALNLMVIAMILMSLRK